MRKSLANALVLCCLLPVSPAPSAQTLYPQPVTPRFEEGDDALTCEALNRQLSQLMPQTYSGKPGFYDDPYHGASIWGGAIWAPGAWTYLGYSGVAEYAEYARIRDARNRIEALRYLKARRRCHE